ncbi:MAG: CBS domain-containing protein [Candidatus Aenigmatarchaeota archaeon]
MLPEIEEIEKRRKNLGLTQKSLAAFCGLSQSLIAKIESKKVNPSYYAVKKIFDCLEALEKRSQITAEQLLTAKVVWIKNKEKVSKAIKLMRRYGYSQLPVFDGKNFVGSISERTILDQISKGKRPSDFLNKKVEEIMEESFPIVTEKEPLSSILTLLQNNHAILVSKKGKIVGIITKADLLKVTNARAS